jgi:F0F1-type ATP synthase beta subunit
MVQKVLFADLKLLIRYCDRNAVGEDINGRLFNVTGDPIDGLPAVSKKGGRPIHSKPPAFENLSTSAEILFTGIKVIDLSSRMQKVVRSVCLVVLVWVKRF